MEDISKEFGEYIRNYEGRIIVSVKTKSFNLGFDLDPESCRITDTELIIEGDNGLDIHILKGQLKLSYDDADDMYVLTDDEGERMEMAFI